MARKLSKKQKAEIRQLEKKVSKLGQKQCSIAERLDAATAKARQKLVKIDIRREKALKKIALVIGETEADTNRREQLKIDRRLFANAPWEDLPVGLLFGKSK